MLPGARSGVIMPLQGGGGMDLFQVIDYLNNWDMDVQAIQNMIGAHVSPLVQICKELEEGVADLK